MSSYNVISADAMMNLNPMLDPLCVDAHLELDDFEPQPRDRSNTWPLQRPSGENYQTSPLIHEEIPEVNESGDNSTYGSGEQLADGDLGGDGLHLQANNKKNTSRRNAWGNHSYADLITEAINSSPDKRLTLSQIYDWMVQNVPYFRDKGDSNSSAGWKNSIRHNLSLHNRFMRIQNEGAGKSSWWVINPEAKPGKSSRRRAGSMETKALEKKRGRAKKKVEQMRMENGGIASAFSESSDLSSAFSLSPNEFRTRSDSNVSNFSTASFNGKHSPLFEEEYESLGHPVNSQEQSSAAHHELFQDIADTMSQSMSLVAENGSGSCCNFNPHGASAVGPPPPNQVTPPQKATYTVTAISGQLVYLTPNASPATGNALSPLASPIKLALGNGMNPIQHRQGNQFSLSVDCSNPQASGMQPQNGTYSMQQMSPVVGGRAAQQQHHVVGHHQSQSSQQQLASLNATPPYTIKQECAGAYNGVKQEPLCTYTTKQEASQQQHQPPAYQELYPVHLNQANSAGLNSNPILRDALIQKCGSAAIQLQHQLQQNAGGICTPMSMAQQCSSNTTSYYAAHGPTLPTELSDITYNNQQRSDFSTIDISPYLQSISGGNNEFDVNFGNINL